MCRSSELEVMAGARWFALGGIVSQHDALNIACSFYASATSWAFSSPGVRSGPRHLPPRWWGAFPRTLHLRSGKLVDMLLDHAPDILLGVARTVLEREAPGRSSH